MSIYPRLKKWGYSVQPSDGRSRVLFLFESGRSESTWKKRFLNGEVADEYPYGLDPKSFDDWSISFARDYFTSGIWSLLRRALRKTVRTDVIHVLFNIRSIYKSDVVISHTEDTCVAYLLIGRFFRNLPPIVAQVVWAGETQNLNVSLQSRLARFSLRSAEVVVTHSTLNAAALSQWLGRPVQVAQYGIDPSPFLRNRKFAADSKRSHLNAEVNSAPVVICAGNDPQRDWDLLREIAVHRRDLSFLVCSRTAPITLNDQVNISVISNARFSDIINIYAVSHCSVIPLKENKHASGLTVALESTAAGVPFVATSGGGLEEYFSNSYRGFISGDCVEDWSRAIDYAISSDGRADLLESSSGLIYDRELTNIGYGKRMLACASDALSTADSVKSEEA
ncbi:glycosyltransferase [Rhodococcus sp. NPDC078407]|uniref:glycosyltransferase n=1 Tax=Rhodococcus sp. NPDC078407 TaxID=3364509 RepID=UPI0037C7AE03